MAFRHDGGDHVILVGEVLEFDHGGHDPLAFKGGRYAYALPKDEDTRRGEATVAPDSSAPDFLIYQLGRAYHQLFARLQPELERRRQIGRAWCRERGGQSVELSGGAVPIKKKK